MLTTPLFPTLALPTQSGESASPGLFGGNILAPRTEMTGEGGYARLVSDLGVTDLRYPGGSLTEEYFDIANPDAVSVTGNENGQTVDFIPLSDFMAAAADLGSAVTIVIPTRTQLSDRVDANGDRLPDIDVETLQDFVHDVATGVYGDAKVAAFEIGNEYWGSGRMSTAEYGRLAAEMTGIIRDELRLVEEVMGTDPGIDVVVQTGWNFGYAKLSRDYEDVPGTEVIDDLNEKYDLGLDASDLGRTGAPNWAKLSNELMISFFEGEGAEVPDGVVTHLYSKGQVAEDQRSFMLRMIDKTWGQSFDDMDVYVTEWNSSAATSLLERDEDYGLYQAHEMLEIVEEFMLSGVDVAHAWPLLQNSANSLAMGRDYVELSPAGQMFGMMSSSLPGKTMLDFAPDSLETEENFDGIELHAFYGAGEMVLYLASTADTVETSTVDISGLVLDADAVSGRVLGVAEGQGAGSNRSDAVIETLEAENVFEDGILTAVLAPGEILQVTLSGLQPSAGFAEVMREIDAPQIAEDPEAAPEIAAAEEAVVASQVLSGENGRGEIRFGGDGGDRLSGSAGRDWIKGARGDDTLDGGAGSDTLIGGRGDDLLTGAGGRDRLRGSEGEDTLEGGEARDHLIGGEGDDLLRGGEGHDRLKGARGDDTLYGGEGDDTLHGGQGGDTLYGGTGANEITTGFGRDTVVVNDGDEDFVTHVTDFTLGRDVLKIQSETITDFDGLRFEETGEALILLLGDGKRVVFDGAFDEDDLRDHEAIAFDA